MKRNRIIWGKKYYENRCKALKDKVTYCNSWVTDIPIDKNNIIGLVKAGRACWKIENETFNTLKNQGYHISTTLVMANTIFQ